MKTKPFALMAMALMSITLRPMVFTTAAGEALADDWKPLDPAVLALKAPVVEKDADAEAVLWDVRVRDEAEGGDPRTVLQHYLRIKVFTDRGRESQSKIDIIFGPSTRISEIAGRTIKPDGKIVELKREDIFERTIVKAGGKKVKAKSFAMPGVEPGSIIEYRYRETRNDQLANYIQLQLQRDIPIHLVRYHIKPLDSPYFPYSMRGQPFHCNNTPFEKEKDGSYTTSMSNVPAFHEEPHMPPEDEVRPWLLVYYAEDKKLTPEKFWLSYGKGAYEKHKPAMKVNDEVRKTTQSVIGDATTQEQKLERIYEFCRTKIKNISRKSSDVSAEEKKKLRTEIKTAADVLKRGMGNAEYIDFLFGAMATAAGMDARFVRLPNRGEIFFDSRFTDSYFLSTYDVAVKVENEWKFFDPGSTYVPFGMLNWEEEGTEALVCDPKESVFVRTYLSPPDKSREKRIAKLRLLEDGSIEGDIRVEFTGHFSTRWKLDNEEESTEEQEKGLKDAVIKRLGTAEVSNIKLENVADPEKPVAYSYHIVVPAYAQRTGKRLLLQPGFFQHGLGPMFPSGTRKHGIYFHYPWSEEDHVSVELPEGFALDNADSPAPISSGDVTKYEVKMGVEKASKTLHYSRAFFFGGAGSIVFKATTYAALKKIFDAIHEGDDHTITLKQASASN
jgi:hypothetical protein